MNVKAINRRLFKFLQESTSPFHAAQSIAKLLEKAGFKNLDERSRWNLKPSQPYYILRDDGSILAFNRGRNPIDGFRIIGTHSDSPALQLKPKADTYEKGYHKLGVEVYGGPLLHPWFDRELSIAGRVVYRCGSKKVYKELIDFEKPVCMIPNIAIHLDRNANKEKVINPQKDLAPVIGLYSAKPFTFHDHLKEFLRKNLGREKKLQVLGHDLFLYDHHTPGYAGIDDEFIVSSRLDNLLSCFAGCSAITNADVNHSFLFVANNHEEIGSVTSSGAQSNMIEAIFERIFPDREQCLSVLANSFFISVDNAHATHPNSPDKHDPEHETRLNGGPVIKINANKRYTSNATSNALFKILCQDANVPYQEFVMRSDMACGSTIGPMTSAKLGLTAVDIGAPSLAMHSIREMTGSEDPLLLVKVLHHFLNVAELPDIHDRL